MVLVNHLTVQFGGRTLFDDIIFTIGESDRIGLVGKNGAGKSTLLRIIAGTQRPESGEVRLPNDFTVGYLPQEMSSNYSNTVMEEAKKAFKEALLLNQKIHDTEDAIVKHHDHESEDAHRLINQLTDYTHRFDILGGNTMERDTERVLSGLGFPRSEFERKIATLSGGWQMRVELAKILLSRPDLILLDEPTNHLDIESIQWLENFLINYRGALILVSHDRKFLDNVTTRTIEISNGKIYDYKANYSRYVIMREEWLDLQMSRMKNQERERAQMERFVDRFRYKASKSKQVQSTIKRMDKLEQVELDEIDSKTIDFNFPPAPRSGKTVLEIKSLSKNFDDKHVLDNISLMIERGERIAFVGKNGEGKTTLLKIIAGKETYEGEMVEGYNMKMAYYAQQQAEHLDGDSTVLQLIESAAQGDARKNVRRILGAFLFSGDDVDKKVKVLSGGEKSRLALAKMLLEPVNFIVLDEPTNHLDMLSKEVLKQALLNFEGAMIVVSHDRDFLAGLTDRVIEFKDKKIREFIGDVYDFIEKKKEEESPVLKIPKKENATKIATQDKGISKKQEKQQQKKQRMIEKCEKEIQELEAKIKEIETVLSDAEQYQKAMKENNNIFNDYEITKQALGERMKEWEKMAG